MADPQHTGRDSGRPLIMRHHSPYCEAAGPIVESGTVAARVKALQQNQVENLNIVRSHTPQLRRPPGRLNQELRAVSPSESLASARLSLRKSHNHLADYLCNEDIESTSGYGRRSPFVGFYAAQLMRDNKRPIQEFGRQSQQAEITTQGAVVPGLVKQKTWLQTIRENAAARTGQMRRELEPPDPAMPLSEEQASVHTTLSDSLPDEIPGLSNIPSEQMIKSPKPVKAHSKTIADQLGDMIDMALDGRDNSATEWSMGSSALEITGISGEVHKGKLNITGLLGEKAIQDVDGELPGQSSASFTRMPQYVDEYTATPRCISSAPKRPNHVHTSEDSCLPRQKDRTKHLKAAEHDRGPCSKHRPPRASTFPRDSSDTDECMAEVKATGRQVKSRNHSIQRARTYNHRRPTLRNHTQCDLNTFKLHTLSNLSNEPENKAFGEGDNYDVYVHEYHDLSVHATKEHKHDDVSRDGRRKASQRTRNAKSAKQLPKQAPVRPTLPSTNPSRWKWWKLVLVDKESPKSERSQIETGLKEKTGWAVEPHPLAECCHEDEGYASNDGNTPQGPRKGRNVRLETEEAAITDGRQKGTLTEPSHSDDIEQDRLCLSGDASLDAFRSTPTSPAGTFNTHKPLTVKQKIKSTAFCDSSRIEVATQGRSGIGLCGKSCSRRSGQQIRVVVSMSDFQDSVVKVDIRPGL